MLYKVVDAEAHPVPVNTSRHCFDTCDFLTKEASAESIQFFNNLTPKKNHIYLLVIAMTASEYYSANKNGDYFYEKDLKRNYKDFEKSGIFWNHDNKDPSKSAGTVIKSFYNDKMHRVELVLEIPKENARHLPDAIQEGRPIAVSMGLKVPQEWCSICGHKTMHSYANRCEHLKFMMNTILHDGRKVFAICGSDFKLFDISIVIRPADKIAYTMMTKTASHRGLG